MPQRWASKNDASYRAASSTQIDGCPPGARRRDAAVVYRLEGYCAVPGSKGGEKCARMSCDENRGRHIEPFRCAGRERKPERRIDAARCTAVLVVLDRGPVRLGRMAAISGDGLDREVAVRADTEDAARKCAETEPECEQRAGEAVRQSRPLHRPIDTRAQP